MRSGPWSTGYSHGHLDAQYGFYDPDARQATPSYLHAYTQGYADHWHGVSPDRRRDHFAWRPLWSRVLKRLLFRRC